MPKDNKEEWIDVDSSSILQISYNKDDKILKVRFPSQKVYKYEKVGPKIVKDFLSSESKGRFFHKRIRKQNKRYPFKKVASQLSKSMFLGRMLSKQTMSEQWENQKNEI